MKQAINQNNELIEVSDDTPVNTVNGIHYLISPEEQAEIESAYQANLPELQLQQVISKRIAEYGSIGEQLDMIFHQGLDAWKNFIEQVKTNNPKPE